MQSNNIFRFNHFSQVEDLENNASQDDIYECLRKFTDVDMSQNLSYETISSNSSLKNGVRKNANKLLTIISEMFKLGVFTFHLYYLGAADGRTVDIVAPAFPTVTFVLLDGGKWLTASLTALQRMANVVIVRSHVYPNSFEGTTPSAVWFTDTAGETHQWVDNGDRAYLNDIRSGDRVNLAANFDIDWEMLVYKDMKMSNAYARILSPMVSGFKVRPMFHQYFSPKQWETKYGHITLPGGRFVVTPFSQSKSAEHLYVSILTELDANVEYDCNKLCDIFAFSNSVIKNVMFIGGVTNEDFCYTKPENAENVGLTSNNPLSYSYVAERLMIRYISGMARFVNVRVAALEYLQTLHLFAKPLEFKSKSTSSTDEEESEGSSSKSQSKSKGGAGSSSSSFKGKMKRVGGGKDKK